LKKANGVGQLNGYECVCDIDTNTTANDRSDSDRQHPCCQSEQYGTVLWHCHSSPGSEARSKIAPFSDFPGNKFVHQSSEHWYVSLT
jgi:hypothetical protein